MIKYINVFLSALKSGKMRYCRDESAYLGTLLTVWVYYLLILLWQCTRRLAALSVVSCIISLPQAGTRLPDIQYKLITLTYFLRSCAEKLQPLDNLCLYIVKYCHMKIRPDVMIFVLSASRASLGPGNLLVSVYWGLLQGAQAWDFRLRFFCFKRTHLGFLTKFRFAKISRNWRNDFRVSRKWGTSFASFAVSRNCRDYERNEFRETQKSRKRRKLEVKIPNLTFFLLILVKMPA
jgi:hypothetical protein